MSNLLLMLGVRSDIFQCFYKLRRLLLFFLVLANCFALLGNDCYAFERKKHDEYTEKVLFKAFKEIDNDKNAKEIFNVLCSAEYLAIDQFNSYGKSDLELLKNYGVKSLPDDISEITFSASGKTHRTYTHRGWDFTYIGLYNNLWKKRKQILINTADKIFDFQGNEDQKDSFCALLYYVHVLGDHLDDNSYKIENGLKIAAGGRKDKYDITHELIKHISIVFKSQQNTQKYIGLISNITEIDGELRELESSTGGINSDEKFKEKQKCCEKLMNQLIYHLPEMLKDEKFFADVFYHK